MSFIVITKRASYGEVRPSVTRFGQEGFVVEGRQVFAVLTAAQVSILAPWIGRLVFAKVMVCIAFNDSSHPTTHI